MRIMCGSYGKPIAREAQVVFAYVEGFLWEFL